jgi:hypothetical protein
VRLHSTVAKCYSFRHELGGKTAEVSFGACRGPVEQPEDQRLSLCNQRFTRASGGSTKVYPLDFCGSTYDCQGRQNSLCKTNFGMEGNRGRSLEFDDPVNAVRAEDTELSFVIAAEVNQATTTLAGAG